MTVFDELRAAVRERMNDITDEVATGAASDFAEYRYFNGLIAGLAYAERALLDIQTRIEQAED